MAGISDRDIVEAYQYMLARWLVLRQERRDLDEGFRWNAIIHRAPGGVSWANPNLDVAYSEAWIAVDDDSATILDLPEIRDRYYTFQLLNGWSEVVLNINERNFPDHAFGRFALCLKGAEVDLPDDVLRVDLPGRKSRLLMRVELGSDPAEAIRLQKSTTLRATGEPRLPDPVPIDFERFPGAEAFDRTDDVLDDEPDINPGVASLQVKARAVAAAMRDPAERTRIDGVIQTQAVPTFLDAVKGMGQSVNGWVRPRIIGNYGSDWQMRTIANFTGIWANNTREVIYFVARENDGGKTISLTFPANASPDQKTRYFWSVIAVDSREFRVIANPLGRFLLNNQSGLHRDSDGSLTLWFAPEKPDASPEPNWLPTPKGGRYNLTFRFYGPSEDVVSGDYFPPPLREGA
ncbi:DUF1214 domain-containing protein [Brevundimonas sp.]|uniref:DUF1214 domain-containing protein n=1 Tax=Brevundimonas sp. TaxID=1871086 RepID=UPI0028AA3301|nr:DUF1214 domain-containing protein [Brevundimonas sp.]